LFIRTFGAVLNQKLQANKGPVRQTLPFKFVRNFFNDPDDLNQDFKTQIFKSYAMIIHSSN
jgi:hypothetical protein